MIHNGYPPEALDPFKVGHLSGGTPPGPPFVVPAAKGRELGEMNTLATLSVIFAFAFAPIGAVMGHLALSQIKQLGQRGRDRALVGLTLSYVVILFLIVAFVLWALTDHDGGPAVVTHPTATAIPTPSQRAATPPLTTVVTPAPQVRKTATVEDLRVGECVEIQQTAPDPNEPGAQQIKIFPVTCQVRDGVFRVDQISPDTNPCGDEYLMNQQRNIFACITKFGGGI